MDICIHKSLSFNGIFLQDGNLLVESFPAIGLWGGTCRCPNGNTYLVGDNNDGCKTLACVGGKMIKCNEYGGPWSYRGVNCSAGKSHLM